MIPILRTPADLSLLTEGAVVHESLLAFLPPAIASSATHVRGAFYQLR